MRQSKPSARREASRHDLLKGSHVAANTDRRRQPRHDRGTRSAGEQPRRRLGRHPQAPAHRLHRRLRLGQVVTRLRHHRRRVPAPDQRDLQRVPPVVHAEPVNRPDVDSLRNLGAGHRGRPGADGRQLPLHRRHRHRRVRHAADPLQPARRAARRRRRRVQLQPRRGHVPDLRRAGPGLRPRRWRVGGRRALPQRRRDQRAQLRRRLLVLADHRRLRPVRPGRQAPGLHRRSSGRTSCTSPPRRSRWAANNWTYEGLAVKVTPALPGQGPRVDAAAHPRLRRPGGHLHHLRGLRRCPAQRGGPVVADRRAHHRRVLRHADQRPGRVRPGHRRPGGRPAGRQPARHCWSRWSRSGWATSAWTASRRPSPAARRSG